jgi:hypothetical protein
MPTTTVVFGGFAHHRLSESEFVTAMSAYKMNFESILERFTKTHGCSSDNLVIESVVESVTEGTPRHISRTWPDLATAQAWVDVVLSENLGQGLEYPPMIISAQVNPE